MSKTVNKQLEEVTNVSKSNSPSFNTELSVCLNTNKIFENDKWVTPTICIFWWSGPRGFSYPRNLVLKTDHEAKIPTNIQSITNNFNSPQKRHYGDVIKISVKSSYNQTAHVNIKFSIFFWSKIVYIAFWGINKRKVFTFSTKRKCFFLAVKTLKGVLFQFVIRLVKIQFC